jgi:hypothetical protein
MQSIHTSSTLETIKLSYDNVSKYNTSDCLTVAMDTDVYE